MSTGTLNVEIKLDFRPLLRSKHAFGMLAIALQRHRIGPREAGRREHQLGRELRAADPRWDVQVVTTNEGRCRVVVRRLGGWS